MRLNRAGFDSIPAALIAVSVLAGCAHGAERRPGLLVLSQSQSIGSLAPARGNGAVGQELGALLHRYLLTLDPSGNLRADAAAVVPSVANGGISPDGRTITYELRPGLRFSDGRRLDARDVAATIEALRAPQSLIPSKLGLDDIQQVELVSNRRLRIRLRRPFSPILLYICAPGNASPILPAGDADDELDRVAPNGKLVGAGPYLVRAFEPGNLLELDANPFYRPAARVRHLLIRTIPQPSTARVELLTRETDGYVLASPEATTDFEGLPGLTLHVIPADGVAALIFNTSDSMLHDATVRQAIAMTLNVDRDVRDTMGHRADVVDAGRGLLLWAYDPAAYALPIYAPARAEATLDEAGWHRGPDGIRERGGRALALTMILRSGQPSTQALAEEFAQELRGVGIVVTLRTYPTSALSAPSGPLYGGRYQLALISFLTGFDPDLTDQFGCARIPPNGYNKSRYCNPKLDAILARASSSYDRSLRITLYRLAQRILARDLPLLPLYRLITINDLPSGLRGVSSSPTTLFSSAYLWRY